MTIRGFLSNVVGLVGQTAKEKTRRAVCEATREHIHRFAWKLCTGIAANAFKHATGVGGKQRHAERHGRYEGKRLINPQAKPSAALPRRCALDW
ncbi:hypothetical protein K470DRAFT_260765 [Piedraia hortae CBS 480.64]|uniref:Uncharacterized protein n=1 Tax=Piedraia hortae CBS 480.64 TaxID=1314780 RepID=A0A6A7BQF1_9PEZI|nr:hypothetical protein K470DRAFT_260765 [Piedraia hortae CBS 480.64]